MSTIYLETSIICHLTDPPSPNPITRACQQLTQLWWHTRCDPAHTFISDFVQEEIEAGDPLRAMSRMASVRHFVSLQKHKKIKSIEELLIGGGGLSAKEWRTAMKLCGVEIPSDIEIPEIDPESKAESDELRVSNIHKYEEMEKNEKDPRFAWFYANVKRIPLPPDADEPLKFNVEKLRLLSPSVRARILYVMRDQVTD